MKVEIHPYDPAWPGCFKREAELLKERLGEGFVVEHVGSTAVEGLAAKPVIDILIGVPPGNDIDEAAATILEDSSCYYLEYWNRVLPFRRFFIKFEPSIVIENLPQSLADERVFQLPRDGRVCHFHMVPLHHPFFREHLLFRDILRRDEKARKDYEALKYELAGRDWKSGADYAKAKTEFIESILNR